MDAIEPIDLIISNEIGRIDEKYEIAYKMSRWEYSDMSMIMLCGVSRKGARNLSFINVYEREIEKFKNGEEEKIAELIEEIENEKLKTQIYIRIAYNLFKFGSTVEEIEKTTRLRRKTICEIKDLVKPEEIEYDPEKIERFKEAKKIVEETLYNKSDEKNEIIIE